MSACDHKFVYEGVRYYHGKWQRPGSGATNRYYAHVYFCERCLEKRSEKIDAEGDCSYFDVRHGAVPGSAGECLVPLEDRR